LAVANDPVGVKALSFLFSFVFAKEGFIIFPRIVLKLSWGPVNSPNLFALLFEEHNV